MRETSPTDRAWIEAAVDEFERPLTLYATRLLGNVERGRDVVQDTFLKLWQADRATVEGHLAKWLYTVCRNRALDVRRKEQRMNAVDGQTMERETAAPTTPEPASATPILALVDGLPERQQEAVRLKFQGGLSYREIAEVMNTTANNVGVLIHTAVKNMRTRLADASPEIATR